MLLFRFLAGISGSAPLSVRSINHNMLAAPDQGNTQLGGRVINGCWSGKDPNGLKHLYTLALLLGPIVGPMAGAWIIMKTTWQWIVSVTLVSGIHFQS